MTDRTSNGEEVEKAPFMRQRAKRRILDTDQARSLQAPAIRGEPRLARRIRLERWIAQRQASLREVSAIRRAACQSSDIAALLVVISGETGARLLELFQAEWPQLGLVNGSPTWTIPPASTMGMPRIVQLTPKAARAFEQLAKLADPTNSRVLHMFRKIQCAVDRFRKFAALQGLRHVRFHEIRTDWRRRTGGF